MNRDILLSVGTHLKQLREKVVRQKREKGELQNYLIVLGCATLAINQVISEEDENEQGRYEHISC